ncbi:MAG: sigma 54-interacting transcriptional regulator, partial [Bauldia sp.]|nr:sigma 54-interacting transcriptional regulator [Bauldia sp.]
RLRAVKTSRRAIQTTPRKIDAPFVCSDPRLVQQMESVAQAVKSSMPVHISGETGTGKELMARHAHNCSGRKGEFVAVNCGAIAESLFVAELFGYEKGAFTDARAEGSPGLIRMADRGTLFLDEVGNMPLAAQAALLRFLDTMEVRPVGGQKNHSVDLQIVSATNRRLEQEVAQRRFREDLLYRLNAMEVVLPPLRERQDFLEVVRFLMDRIAPGVAITDKAIERLRDRAWPGNFRELRATLQRVVIRAGNRILDEGAIALFLGDGIQADDACPECRGHALKSDACRRIRQSHRTTGGNIAETARLLGVSRTTVYKHLRGPEEATGTEWNRPLYKGGAVGVVVGAAS